MADSGLAADLSGVGEKAFAPTGDGTTAGALFDTFVTTGVCKQTTWSERSVDLSYFRDRDGAEVDLIVEDRQARHLIRLRDKLGDRFRTGLVIHAGTQTLPLGERIWAVPVSTLWAT